MATLVEHSANIQEGNVNVCPASASAAASASSGEGSQAGGGGGLNTSGGQEGSYIGEGDLRFVAAEDLQRVQGYIESCLQAYMPQQQVIATLQHHCKIHPSFTATVWQRLMDQNPEFFKMYHLRLKLKDQIVMFNYLLEQQVGMVQKLYASWLQALPPAPPMPSGANGMNMMGMMPPNSMPQGQDGAAFGFNPAANRMMMGPGGGPSGGRMPGGGGMGGGMPQGMMMNPQMMMMMGGGGMPMMTGPSHMQQQHLKGAGSSNNSQHNDAKSGKGRGSTEVNRNEISYHSTQSTGLGAFQLPTTNNNHRKMQQQQQVGQDTLEGILNIDEKNFSFAELAAFDMDQVMDDFSLHHGPGGGMGDGGREEGQESGRPQSTPQTHLHNLGRHPRESDPLHLGGEGMLSGTQGTPGLGVFSSHRDADLSFNGADGMLSGGNLLNSHPGLELMDLGGDGKDLGEFEI